MKIHLLLAILSGFVRAAVPGADAENPGMWEKRSSFLRGRIFHTAVWTYSEMIVWGGGSEHQFYNDGGIYDPYKDHWRSMEEEGAPSGRWAHAAVWTGTEMLVWVAVRISPQATTKTTARFTTPRPTHGDR